MPADIQTDVNRIIELLQRSPWERPDFWLAIIGVVVGVAGLIFSVKAFIEAKAAKVAAKEAGKTVRVQTVAIELGEILQKLERLQPNIRFAVARDLLGDASKRIRRAIAPFSEVPSLKNSIAAVRQALDSSQESLKRVRPVSEENETEAPNAVYNGVESDFGKLSDLVADLLGLFEKETFDRS